MEIKCPNCKTRYRIDRNRIDEKGILARCGKFSHILLLRRVSGTRGEREATGHEQTEEEEADYSKSIFVSSTEKVRAIAKVVGEKSRTIVRVMTAAVLLVLFFFTGYLVTQNLLSAKRLERKVDFQGADLRTVDLRKEKLSGANLWRSDLSGVQLQKANLQGAYLCEANLQGVNLLQSNLERVALAKANLQGATLRNANLEDADLPDANLKKADLRDANLKGAFMKGANLQGANLKRSDLRESWGLTVEQLSKVKTLYGAKLRPKLLEQVKEEYPHLFEMSSDDGER